MKKRKQANHKEFSKILLIQESALIWIITIAFILLAFLCVVCGFVGSLPWLTPLVGFPWTAYGVSQACYYNKSKKENIKGGIKYATTMQQFSNIPEEMEDFDLNSPI